MNLSEFRNFKEFDDYIRKVMEQQAEKQRLEKEEEDKKRREELANVFSIDSWLKGQIASLERILNKRKERKPLVFSGILSWVKEDQEFLTNLANKRDEYLLSLYQKALEELK